MTSPKNKQHDLKDITHGRSTVISKIEEYERIRSWSAFLRSSCWRYSSHMQILK